MKRFAVIFFSIVSLFSWYPLQAQPDSTLFQAAPDAWRAEIIPFPLSFAPEIELDGIEELRFAPGMFDPDSETFFTYAFIWWLEGQPDLDRERLESDLMKYYQGLYKAVSKNKNKKIEGFRLTVEADSAGSAPLAQVVAYRGKAVWVDPFVTEKELVLYFKASQWHCRSQDRTAVLFWVSPMPYDHPNWQTLAGLRAGACSDARE